MTFESGKMKSRLPAALVILGVVLLIAACGSDGGNGTAMVEAPAGGDGMPGAGEQAMAGLGEWNTLAAGALDISDANDLLQRNPFARGPFAQEEAIRHDPT